MTFTIGQAAQVSGIPARTIRFYEAAGVLPAPARTASGYRQYTPEHVQRLEFVRRARVLGLSLSELRHLLRALDGGGGPPMRRRLDEAIRAQLSGVRARIRELELLERELGRVLRRIETATRNGPGGPCRCLEAPARTGEPRRGRCPR